MSNWEEIRETHSTSGTRNGALLAFLFDLDGTLVDSVYQHVLAWREALERAGMELAVWRIHRRIGMSGGLLVNALLRETGKAITQQDSDHLQKWHAESHARFVPQVRPLPGATELLRYSVQTEHSLCHCDQRSDRERAPIP
jgi:beta-phosphoglucomutase-like phosphatase (HAD superfamily)